MCMSFAKILNMIEGLQRRKSNMILTEMVTVVEPPDHHYTIVSLSQLTKASWAGFTLQARVLQFSERKCKSNGNNI